MPDTDIAFRSTTSAHLEHLVSALLSGGLALALVTPKGFGALLALLFLVALFSLRVRALRALRHQDWVFLLLFNVYPLLIGFNMVLHGVSDVGLFDNASRFLFLSVVYIVLRSTGFRMTYVILGAMVGCVLTFCAAFHHLLLGPPTRFGAFENPIIFAQIAFFLLLIAATPVKLTSLPDDRARLLLFALIVATSITLAASQSRGPLMALAAFYGYLLFVDFRRPAGGVTKLVLLVFGVGAVLFLTASADLQHLEATTAEFFANYERIDQLTSTGRRLAQWSLSWILIAEEPWFGHGVGQFNAALSALPDAASLTPTVRSYNHAHNDLINMAVEQGLVSVTVFLASLAAIAFLVMREEFGIDARHLVLGTMGFWLFFALSQTQFAHQKTTMMFALLLLLGFCQGMNEKFGTLLRETR